MLETELLTTATHVSVEEICQKIIKDVVLDVFVLIENQQHVSKSEILRQFAEFNGDKDVKGLKYRNTVDVAIGKLEGAMFIESFTSGRSEQYYLTSYGKEAVKFTMDYINDNPSILLGSKIASKLLYQNSEGEEDGRTNN
ncbi:hypothetical protein ACIFOE_25850 [Paenibacillus sp. NRS-1783]|uniref:hypothetical protein n=1 Tax=Paenibacillus sp. NRS-1783 TaxID=3233907 RepID=UPI003D2D5387